MYVYKITNKINGKAYVGQTRNSVQNRWQEHCSGCNGSSRSLIHRAIRKYGRENFIFKVIEICNSLEELNAAEEHAIEHHNTMNPFGYNLIGTNRGVRLMSEITRQRMRQAQKRRPKPTEETRQRRSKSLRGLKRTDETRERIALAKIGKLNPAFGKTPANAKAVIGWNEQTGEGWFFKSLEEAKQYGFDASNICTVCKGRLTRHRGFRWAYAA